MIDDQQAEAQQTVDELFNERLLPFKLFTHRVEPIGHEEYIVRFHDCRLHYVDVSWQEGQNFKDVFRAALLERVKALAAFSGNTVDDQTGN